LALVRQAQSRSNGKARWDEAGIRGELAQLTIDFEVARLLLHRAVQMHSQGVDYRAQAAMCKVFNTELAQRIYATGVGLLGPHGTLLGSDYSMWNGAIAHGLLSSVQDTIGAGTSEVQREIIALRGLGLPRG
jgi:alkylation response protein AidB-like acyl-CoA dehydrogenase